MSSDGVSVRFDRAADYYDRTRAVLPETMEAVLAEVVPELIGSRRVLEIGAGTGRFTRPLRSAGIDVVGLDLSLPMLEKLVETSVSDAPPLAAGDATRLPFEDDSFGAGFAVHVLHLVPAWQEVLAELVRVIEPGGKFLVDVGNWGFGEWKRMQQVFCDEAGIEMRHPGIAGIDDVDGWMQDHGARARWLGEVAEVRRRPYAELLESLERGLWSFTWRADEAARRAGAAAVREMLRSEGLKETDEAESTHRIRWRAYDLP